MSKFGGMGNCFPFIRKHQKGNRCVSLAILGLDNAGKTTTAKSIQGESLEGIGPTVGFEKIEFSIGKFNIDLFDLGGGKGIRSIWKSYLSEVFGLIYVIDSSDPQRMEEARDNLHELFSSDKVKEKPVLLLANKQDKDCAMDEGEIVEILNLVTLVNENQIPCRLERCAAVLGAGRKMDKAIKAGLRWLLTYIDAHLEMLQERVEADVARQREEEAAEREAKRERVRRMREEREREREREGGPAAAEEEEIEGDPFRPLDFEALKRKEEAEKAEKARRKAAAEAAAAQAPPDPAETPADDTPAPALAPALAPAAPMARLGPEPPPVLAGSALRGQFYSPRGGEEEARAGLPPPLKPGSRLEPLDAGEAGETARRKKKKKRSRLGRKHRLAPDPLGAEESGEEGEEGSSGLSSLSRTPSRPDLFVTEKIYTLDELDEDDNARLSGRVGPNGDSGHSSR